MNDNPTVWHFGLMAERWAEFLRETPELPFFRRAIRQYGQPVLDLACGTGRLLLPLLDEGIDIDGCDVSGDMLRHCRAKAAAANGNPNLYRQSMHALDLPRCYRTIYICASFGLAGSRENDLETLRRCYAALEPGGALLVNIEAEYASPEAWNLWTSEGRRSLPQPWPENPQPRTAADGSEHIGRFRTVALDPLEQTITRQVRLEKRVAGELVASEEYTLRGNLYFKQEFLLMLKIAGFQEIILQGDYGDEAATADSAELVFTAIK